MADNRESWILQVDNFTALTFMADIQAADNRESKVFQFHRYTILTFMRDNLMAVNRESGLHLTGSRHHKRPYTLPATRHTM